LIDIDHGEAAFGAEVDTVACADGVFGAGEFAFGVEVIA